MKSLIVSAMLGVSAVGASFDPADLVGFINDLYPANASQRQALQLCMLRDANFNRIDPAAREACYRHELTVPQTVAARATTRVAPNAVDLRLASAWQNAPGNDIRIIEAAQGFTASLADGPTR
jgi:hypothetical protein